VKIAELEMEKQQAISIQRAEIKERNDLIASLKSDHLATKETLRIKNDEIDILKSANLQLHVRKGKWPAGKEEEGKGGGLLWVS
jgi:DNA-directed RNA polymerase alpha subunit